jgi:hypothetical protein
MHLRKPPIRPQWLPFVAVRIDSTASIPEAWTHWLYWHGALAEDETEPPG